MAHEEKKDHSVSEGVGAASGAVGGMTVGAAVGGPVGAVVGAAVGAVVGGITGHGVAAAFDPEVENAYWRENYKSRPYVKTGADYADYESAYRYGGQSRATSTSDWNETSLAAGWDKAKANSKLGWSEAKDAVRDGWHRVERATPGDADGDGR